MVISDAVASQPRVAQRELLFCFSHLRWNFVKQCPQHPMLRLARCDDAFIWEVPVFNTAEPRLDVKTVDGVRVTLPHLPHGIEADAALKRLLDDLVARDPRPLIRWYYTPIMWSFSGHLNAAATIYDCVDELANFDFAPPELLPREAALLAAADVIFTGGHSPYEAKRGRHDEIHPFPSDVDVAHFARARLVERAGMARPTLGFYWVMDQVVGRALTAYRHLSEEIAADAPLGQVAA